MLGSANVDEALRGYMTKYDCSSADILYSLYSVLCSFILMCVIIHSSILSHLVTPPIGWLVDWLPACLPGWLVGYLFIYWLVGYTPTFLFSFDN